MKLVINVKRSQLRGVLQELGGSFPNMDIVINIKEEEPKEKPLDYQHLTTESLERLQSEMKEKEEKEKEKEEKEKEEKEKEKGEYPT